MAANGALCAACGSKLAAELGSHTGQSTNAPHRVKLLIACIKHDLHKQRFIRFVIFGSLYSFKVLSWVKAFTAVPRCSGLKSTMSQLRTCSQLSYGLQGTQAAWQAALSTRSVHFQGTCPHTAR